MKNQGVAAVAPEMLSAFADSPSRTQRKWPADHRFALSAISDTAPRA
jgi:hypothetical protein